MVLMVIGPTRSLAGQQPDQPDRQLAVDRVVTKEITLSGVVTSRNQEKVTLAVDRDWFVKTYPERVEWLQEQETSRLQPLLKSYRQRMEAWRNNFKGQADLIDQIDRELERILETNQGIELQRKQFALLEIPTREVLKTVIQPPQRRQIAGLAWQVYLPNVSTSKHNDLRNELIGRKIDLKKVPNLVDRLPASELSDREWAIRRALFEYAVTGKLEFQGQGSLLIPSGGAQDISKLLGQMLSNRQGQSLSELGRELGLPEFSATPKPRRDEWKDSLFRQAESQSANSLVVKRILDGNDSSLASVEILFMAQVNSDGPSEWVTAGEFRSETRLADVSPDELQALIEDPQVKQSLGLLRQLGLANGSAIELALRKGAAVQKALRKASDQFETWVSRNTTNLDGPFWPGVN